MSDKISKYIQKSPELVYEWKDEETGAEGWVVINSLRGGAAGGGTRMRIGCTKEEVLALAKTMEIKFSVSGPRIGGAKSGINFDPSSPLKELVLKKWYTRVLPLLKHFYGTGGDMNIDEIHEVIPITKDLGLLHPQEGIVQGHFNPKDYEKSIQIKQLQVGVCLEVLDKDLNPFPNSKYLVADLITGYGVAESIKHYYSIYLKQNVENKRVIVQGFGNVAGAACYYLAKLGCKIVGIIDKNCGLISNDGYDFQAIASLMKQRNGNELSAFGTISFEQANQEIWNLKADIFVPAAGSKIVSRDQINSLIDNGLEVVSCGANVPFADKEVIYGEIAREVDSKITVIPDFIANCGMARVFSYLMLPNSKISENNIFEDVSQTIKKSLEECYEENNSSKNLQKTALDIAINKLS